MTRTTSRILLGVVTAAALAALLLGELLLPTGPRAPAGARAAAGPMRLRFAEATEYVYDLAWHDQQATAVAATDGAPQQFAGRVDLEGRLVVRSFGQIGGNWLVGMRLTELRRHELEILGRRLLEEDATAEAQLGSAEAIVEIAADGTIGTIRFDRAAPALFAQLVPVLLTELDVRLPDGSAARGPGGWRADGAGPFGAARSRFAVDGATGTLTRSRERYDSLAILPGGLPADGRAPQLRSAATIALAPSGPWQTIDDEEQLTLEGADGATMVDAAVTLRLALVETRPGAPTPSLDLAAMEQRRPGESTAGGNPERYALEQQAAGLTRADLMAGLSAPDGAIADLGRWLWRASGLLQLEPALCGELGQLVAGRRLRGANAELALDLLASAGTPAAQAGLRAALASAEVQGGDDYGMLLQRASLLDAPTPETAAFIAAGYTRSRAPGGPDTDAYAAGAAAYTLGAVVQHLDRSGQGGLARRYNAVLVADLRATDDPAAQITLLTAVGNAGLADDVDLVVDYAGSDDAGVRAAAANALRLTDTPKARDTLHDLLADSATDVQGAAIDALRRHAIGARDLDRLAATVARRGVDGGNEARLVDLVAGHLGDREASGATAATATLQRVAEQPSTPTELRARIASLLRQQG